MCDVLEPRREQGIVGWREGQLVDDDDRQRLSLNVDAFPETLAAEQHSVTEPSETRQQFRS